jgi:hypothetical protein
VEKEGAYSSAATLGLRVLPVDVADAHDVGALGRERPLQETLALRQVAQSQRGQTLEWSCVSFHATSSEKLKFFTLMLSRFTSGRQNDGIYNTYPTITLSYSNRHRLADKHKVRTLLDLSPFIQVSMVRSELRVGATSPE